MDDEAMTNCVRRLFNRGLNSTAIAGAIAKEHGVEITRQKVAVFIRHILSPDYKPPQRRRQASAPIHVWNEKRDAFASDLWRAGATASEIAVAMNRHFKTALTKNAVIGRLHRLRNAAGEKARGRPAAALVRARDKAKAQKPPKPKERRQQERVARVMMPDGTHAPLDYRLAVFTPPETSPRERVYGTAQAVASVTGCRWPYGDAGSDKFHFCDAEQCEGSSYCQAHHAIAYRGVPEA